MTFSESGPSKRCLAFGWPVGVWQWSESRNCQPKPPIRHFPTIFAKEIAVIGFLSMCQ